MKRTDYLTPRTLEETLKALRLRRKGAQIIAGGTDLIPRIRSGSVKPSILIDLRLLKLNHITVERNFIRIGACATHTEFLESSSLSKYLPMLVETAKEIAGPPVRNRGTIGGNLVNASPAADFASPLLVYDARVALQNWFEERVIPLEDFFVQPGKTVLKSDEMLTEIIIPSVPRDTGAKFIKLGKRKAMAIAVASVAVRLTVEKGVISIARIALGSVAPTPIRAKNAEAFLVGKIPDEKIFAEAGQIASSESSPISDIRASENYRKKMVSVLTRRALMDAWSQINERISNESN